MSMSKENLEKNIKKMLSVIRPDGVLMIDFELDNFFRSDNEYSLSLTYVVPDNSPYLKLSNKGFSDDTRTRWNKEIKKSIENYFDTGVLINQSGLSSETFYKQQKEREKLWQKN